MYPAAVAGDREILERALQILRLEVQILMPRVRQGVLETKSVEKAHHDFLARGCFRPGCFVGR